MNGILNPGTKEAYQLMHDGVLALARAEQHGMRVDMQYIKKAKKKLSKEIDKLEKEFKKTKFFKKWQKKSNVKVNIYAHDQLKDHIYNELGYKVEKETATGQGSTDIESLQQLQIPALDILIRISKLKKVKDTFLANLENEAVNGIVHPFFHLHIPRTYRGSSSNPNFQNFPKRDEEQMKIIRGAIYPSKGHQLLELDYSQLEVRVANCYHNDPTMTAYINDPTADMHRDMAQQIFKIKKFSKEKTGHGMIRSATKNGFVFPEFYGDYYASCAEYLACKWASLPKYGKWKKGDGMKFEKGNLADHMIKKGITELGLAKINSHGKKDYKSETGFTSHLKEIEKHFWEERFPVYTEWKDEWYAEYQANGYFYNKTGFTFQGLMTKKDAINYPVQSSAFHILLWSFIQGVKAQRGERWRTRLIGQIHDAIVFDVHPDELQEVINIMKCIMEHDVRQHWKWITVPLEVEAELCPVDAPWSMKEDYKIN